MKVETFETDGLTTDAFLGGKVMLQQPRDGYRAGVDPVLLAASIDAQAGQTVLDLGCGAGDPIGVWLHDQAFDVTGSDFSRDMLTLFAARIPGAKTVFSDMRDLSLPDRFDAIIGWGSFFHLTRDEQRTALPKIAKHLAPGGRLLLTVGPGEGEATGHVGHDEVFHASLSETAYRDLLEQNGCCVEAFVREDPECRGFTLLLARANALGATI